MIFLLSVGFGIAAAVLSMLYLKSREAAIRESIVGKEEIMVAVVVAKQDLPKGQKVQVGDYAIREVPSDYVHPNAISPDAFGNYVGRFLVTDISRGKPVLTSFIEETFPVDFSDLVKQNRRAVTVQVDEPTSIAGMMRPGNRIDLYVNIGTRVVGYEATAPVPAGLREVARQAGAENVPEELLETMAGARATDVILPVLQDVLVLATGREAYDEHLDALGQPQQRRTTTFTTVTLDVTPEQAALLAIADDKGDLIGVLRNRRDRGRADFTGITPLDLLQNATKMKQEAALRQAAAEAGATIDENGNWVTADGRVIDRKDILISEDGRVTTKDGQLLAADAALRKAAAEAGATIDENGNWVTADGRVIDRKDILISEEGTVTTKGGQLLAAKGISINEKGEYVDADGNVIPENQLVFNPDGTVTTQDEIMKAAGYTVNENGDYVDADGNVFKRDEVKVLANGTVMTEDGRVLSGPRVKVNEQGFIIAADGTVMTADGKVISGVAVNEKGEVIGPDGKVLADANLIVAADGTVRDSSGNIIAGISGSSLPPTFGVEELEQLIAPPLVPRIVAIIIGGAGKDGVALTNTMEVQPVAVEFPARPPEGQ